MTARSTMLTCENHEEVLANNICDVCGKPICDRCSIATGSVNVCSVAMHRTVAESWALVYSGPSEFESDVVSRNLEVAKIQTQSFSSRIYQTTLGGHEPAVVKVFVPRNDLGRALETLESLGLADFSASEQ